jgi:hypothetical protein
MYTTVREDAAVAYDPGSFDRVWALVLAHHRTPEALGVRRVLLGGTALTLGRACEAFGEGVLDDPLVSRAHARLEADARGSLTLNDLGSANGTWVDGERVGAATLREGAIVRVGSTVFVAQRAPATYPVRRSARCPAVAWATASFLERLRARAASSAPVRITGAPRAAWWPYVAFVAAELGRPIDAADAGPDADTLVMPRLAERVEDLPWLARAALAHAVGRVPAMDASFATRLLLASWPEDVDGLTRWAAAVAARPERHDHLTWVGEDLALSGGPRAAPDTADAAPPDTSPALQIARDGTWFRVADEAPIDLRTRFALARVLRALADLRDRAPGETLSLEALVQAGWPQEQLIADSGANRAYVAIATLRKLGLRERIERREGGYRLAPRATIVRVEGDLDGERGPRAHG